MKTKIILHRLMLILFLMALIPASAKNIYVATNGSDRNPGTNNRPFKTIQKAADVVKPGDVVLIKRGIYREQVKITRSGSANKMIKFKAYPGDELKAIVEGKTFLVLQSSHIEISGLKVQNIPRISGPTVGIYVEGPAKNIIIKNNHTYNTFGSGIGVWGVGHKKNPGNFENIRNLKILNNKVEKACNKGWNECITVSNGIVDFEIKGNEIFNGGDPINGGEGIDVKLGAKNGIIADNYIHDLTRRGIYLDANGGAEFAKPVIKNIKVYNNVSRNNNGHGMAIMTEGIGDVFNIDIYNNVFYENRDDGLMIYKHPVGSGIIHNIRVYNNTMVAHKRHGFLLAFPGSYNIKAYNNILYDNDRSDYKVSNGMIFKSNNLIGVNPKFVNASAGNFRLKPGSPAINGGASRRAPIVDILGKRRTGKPDIGAYEFSGRSNNRENTALENTSIQVKLSPNPVSRQMSLDLSTYMDRAISYKITSMTGKELKTGHFTKRHRTVETIDLSSELMDDGMYIIDLTSKGEVPVIIRFMMKK